MKWIAYASIAAMLAGCKRADCPALLESAHRGDVSAVEAALAKTPVDCVDPKKRTALHIAAIENKKDVAATLLDHGAKIELNDGEQRTPLCETAKHNSAEVTDVLIARGAMVEAPCRGIAFTALHIAAGADAADVVKVLLAHGAKVNARNAWEQTPLHQAASEAASGVEVSKLLIDGGGELEIHDNQGFTPLIDAARHNVELVRTLLERGANPNATTNEGFPSLNYATKAKRADIAELLTAKGAKPRSAPSAPGKRVE
jgi:ankyrin repeat protein